MEPKEWIPPTPPVNNEDSSLEAAAASAHEPEILKDPVQSGEVRLHSWQLFVT